MKYFYKIGEQHIRFHRHFFVISFFPHIAVNDTFLPESPEICIPCVLGFQGFIRIITGKTVQDPPVICPVCLIIYCFKIQVYASGTEIVFQKVVGSGILKNLS